MRRGVAIVATVLRIIGYLIVAILVLHVLLTVFDANPANTFATWIKSSSETFSLGLRNLFLPKNPKVAVGVNYGIAAIAWVIITQIVVGLVRRVRR